MASMEEQRAQKFYELKQQGITEDEISNIYFLPASHVRKIIKDYEKGKLPTRTQTISSSTPRMRAFAEKAEKFYHLQLEGKTVEDIAAMHSVTPANVYYALTSYKHNHLSSPTKEDLRGKEFRELRLKGVTLEGIASMHGITRERVRQIVTRYERDHNLPSSKHIGGSLADRARQADIEEHNADKKRELKLQSKHFVETLQLDAELVGRFLQDLGDRGIYYRYYGRYNKRKSDGAPHPGSNNPTHIAFHPPGKATQNKMVTLHTWVLAQYGIEVPEEYHCHHIDGDVTNNMRENLQVISNVEHGRITIQEQKTKGTFNFHNPKTKAKKLTVEQVEEIRAAYIPRVTIVSELESRYGVKQATLYKVIYGWGAYRNVSPETIRRKKPQDDGQLTLDFDA